MLGTTIALLTFVACLARGKAHDDSHYWDYSEDGPFGPQSWGGIETFKDCNGAAQSPIDITGAVNDPDLKPIDFSEYKAAHSRQIVWPVSLQPNTFKIVVPEDETISIRSPNMDRADLLQFHFHWGANDETGSEHYINGRQFPLEAHFVHQKVDQNAARSLIVVGVMFEISPDNSDNPAVAAITDAIKDINEESVKVESLRLEDLLPVDTSVFYAYNGSLTTPACSEIVEWNVLANTVAISEIQLVIIRNSILKPSLDGNENEVGTAVPVKVNYRPLQPINGRKILFRSDSTDISGNDIDDTTDSTTSHGDTKYTGAAADSGASRAILICASATLVAIRAAVARI